MTRPGKKIALALTWDGARWPMKKLSLKARAFLGEGTSVPTAVKLAGLFRSEEISELRICWIPKLLGGADVLTSPFETSDGKRLAFRSIKLVELGDALGVIYRPELILRQAQDDGF